MKHIEPNTTAMDHALLAHAKGGEAITKPALYLHAQREAVARSNGMTWHQWQAKRERETVAWWREFTKGEQR